MKILPFGNNILVQPAVKKQVLVSEEGMLCEYGTAIAIGDEVKKVKVGDNIGYSVFGIEKLVIEEEKFYLIPEDPRYLLGFIV